MHLKTLPTLLEVILLHLFKACHEDDYDKINELSNIKCSLVSFFNKLRDAANELDSKKKLEDLELHLKQYWEPYYTIQLSVLSLCNASK